MLLAADKLGFADVSLHGTGRLILEWAQAFDPERVELTTCVLRHPGPLAGELRERGVAVEFFGDSRFSARTLWRFVRLIRERRIDVLHLQGYGSTTFGRLAALITGTPVIVHVHSNGFDDPGGYPRYVELVNKLLAPHTARAVAVSEATREFSVRHMGFRPEQVEVLHNPTPQLGYERVTPEQLVELRARHGIPDDALVVGVASRLYAPKGHRVLLEAFAQVARRLAAAWLLVVGDGPERPSLEDRAHALGIGRNVTFVGFQPDVAPYLRLCRVTAVPSTHPEPFGLVAVESLAAGVPVVASRAGGLPEVITDGVAGLLVRPGDADDLAAALLRVLGDPETQTRLASECARESERFSMEGFVERMEELYRAVASVSGVFIDAPATAHTPDTSAFGQPARATVALAASAHPGAV